MTNSIDNLTDNLVQSEQDGINFLDVLQTIADNLRLLLLGPLAIGVLTLAYCFTITPTYTAKTLFLPPQQAQSSAVNLLANLGNLGGVAGAAVGIKNPADLYLAYLRSAVLQDALIEQFDLNKKFSQQNNADTRGILTGKVQAASTKEGLILLQVSDKDPTFAADIANAHVQQLSLLQAKFAVTEAQQRRVFFEKQLITVKDRLTDSEVALKSTGVSGNVLKSNPVSAASTVAALQAQVTVQELKIGAMRGYFAQTAPDFQQALKELDNLRAQLAKQERDSPVASQRSNGDDYITKYRNFKYNETLFELFAKQLEIAKVDEAKEGSFIQVLDPAEPPKTKSSPKKAQITFVSVLFTLILLLVFVFTRKALDNASVDKDVSDKLEKLKSSLYNAISYKKY